MMLCLVVIIQTWRTFVVTIVLSSYSHVDPVIDPLWTLNNTIIKPWWSRVTTPYCYGKPTSSRLHLPEGPFTNSFLCIKTLPSLSLRDVEEGSYSMH